MKVTNESIVWFVHHLIIGCGGVGYDFLAKFIRRLPDLPKEMVGPLLNMLLHLDVDEKVLVAVDQQFGRLQKIFNKENLITLLNQPTIRQELSRFDVPFQKLQDTESGMSQSPLLTDLLGMLFHTEIESEVRRLIRQGFGCLGSLGRILGQNGYALHQRSIIWAVFGSGGGVGPAFGRRVGEILRYLKLDGAMPPVSIVGLIPMASVYEIDQEKKSRALAINHTLLTCLDESMNGRSYNTHQLRGNRFHTRELNGLFDSVICFGSGQDHDILFYDNVIDHMVELVWQTSSGGTGVEFLSSLANEVRVSNSNQLNDRHEPRHFNRSHEQFSRSGNSRDRVPKGTGHRVDGSQNVR